MEAGRTDKKHLVTAETTLDELVKLYRTTGDARENDAVSEADRELYNTY